MSNAIPQQWEIWHARFNFSEGKGYKYRPVIILGARADGSLVMMVTSAANKLSLKHDRPILDWQDAGLDKPSIARADRIAVIPPDYIGNAGKIGCLSARDIRSISAVLNEMV